MSTETKNPYTEQVMRCSSLPKFPLYPQGVKELRETLRKHTSTLDRAVSVMDRVIDKYDRCPTPKELTEVAREVAQEVEAVPQGCELCGGRPWVSVEKMQFEFPNAHGVVCGKVYAASGAERCMCSKGQWFRQKDRENEAKRANGLPV